MIGKRVQEWIYRRGSDFRGESSANVHASFKRSNSSRFIRAGRRRISQRIDGVPPIVWPGIPRIANEVTGWTQRPHNGGWPTRTGIPRNGSFRTVVAIVRAKATVLDRRRRWANGWRALVCPSHISTHLPYPRPTDVRRIGGGARDRGSESRPANGLSAPSITGVGANDYMTGRIWCWIGGKYLPTAKWALVHEGTGMRSIFQLMGCR